MDKKFQLKRKHHHIWAHYLKHWSLDDLNVWYTTKKGNYRCDSVYGLAAERDFYKINFLNDEDVRFIRNFSSKSPDELRQIHNGYLNDFCIASRAAKLAETMQPPEHIKQRLEAFQYNVLENLHGSHETDVIEILACLNRGDISVFETSESRVKFKQFFAMQMTRTKSFKKKAMSFAVDRESFERHPNPPFSFETYSQLMEKNWWFLSYMFGMNIGANLTATQHDDKQVLLINETSQPFITSDNPIINVHESMKKIPEGQAPQYMDAFYPLSPKYAYMINNSDRYPSGKVSITRDEALVFNVEMAARAEEHLFAQTESQLKEVKRLCRERSKKPRM
ncbi:DUF4238 domain-containing protein [Lacimicrobium alkaliphilum]|uniref:DUF4238 domain-containing protein n=1 Tax=Lacimicrobium alkaliphilum TaxID=1526571 RepID=A0A0U3AH04_9ALTE|nr:DUF4238 domain-containing protein [Lacimicrobium alkaliphilum]ALS97330.1 hypothetical protein AT746_02955 [Lacimicrobium alkaliphilum]